MDIFYLLVLSKQLILRLLLIFFFFFFITLCSLVALQSCVEWMSILKIYTFFSYFSSCIFKIASTERTHGMMGFWLILWWPTFSSNESEDKISKFIDTYNVHVYKCTEFEYFLLNIIIFFFNTIIFYFDFKETFSLLLYT